MAERLFFRILDLGAMGGCVILAVLVIRCFLRKAPKIYSYCLWSAAAFRLICPVSLSSWLSLFNLSVFEQGESLNDSGLITRIPQNAAARGTAEVVRGVDNLTGTGSTAGDVLRVRGNLSLGQIGSGIWIAGVVLLLLYGGIAYFRVQKKISRAVLMRENIFECDEIASPFVMGLMSPKIYVPFRLPEEQMLVILLHEQYHIRRRDYLVKLFAFVLLAVYWFHPLVWAAYYCMERDMEMSCDEWVIRHLGENAKADYSMALLCFAAGRRFSVPRPLSFGESQTKGRIKNILRFRRLGVWSTAGLVCLCAVLLVICGTNGTGKKNYIQFQNLQPSVSESMPGESSSFSYRLQKKIRSFALYTEVYHNGSLQQREVKVCKGVGEGWIPFGGTGTTGFWVERSPKGGYSAAHLNLQFSSEDAGYELVSELPGNTCRGISLSVLEASKEADKAFRKVSFEPEQDLVLTAVNASEGILHGYSCKDFMENPWAVGENDLAILYRIIFSEKDQEELMAGLAISRQANALFEARHPYLGDASANGKLLGILSGNGYMPKAVYTTELETSGRPYVLRVVYEDPLSDDRKLERTMMRASALLLALTDNLDEVQWQFPLKDAGEETLMTRYWDESSLPFLEDGSSIKEYGSSAGRVQELLDLLQAEDISVIGGAEGPVTIYLE